MGRAIVVKDDRTKAPEIDTDPINQSEVSDDEKRDYSRRILKLDERLTNQMQERVLQNANFMSLAITFVFLFEVQFISGAFPNSMKSIDYNRYSSCLCILVWANSFLVLSFALLLRATSCLTCPFPALSDHFPPVIKKTELDDKERSLRYGINQSYRRNLNAAERVVTSARRCTMIGMLLGILSAVVFCINGGLLKDVLHLEQKAGEPLLIGASFWTLIAVSSVVLICVYRRLTAEIRKITRPVKQRSVMEWIINHLTKWIKKLNSKTNEHDDGASADATKEVKNANDYYKLEAERYLAEANKRTSEYNVMESKSKPEEAQPTNSIPAAVEE